MNKNSNFRFDEEDKKLIALLSKHFGISKTDVLRMLIRKAIREEKIGVLAQVLEDLNVKGSDDCLGGDSPN